MCRCRRRQSSHWGQEEVKSSEPTEEHVGREAVVMCESDHCTWQFHKGGLSGWGKVEAHMDCTEKLACVINVLGPPCFSTF